MIEPKLLKEQFDETGKAAISLYFSGKHFHITFVNIEGKDYGEYSIQRAGFLNDSEIQINKPSDRPCKVVILPEVIAKLPEQGNGILIGLD